MSRQISKELEFQTLKDEVAMLSQKISDYTIALYTLCIAIASFSIERQSAILSLIIYLVIFSFQLSITKAQEGSSRISAYIQVFIEEDSEEYWYWSRHRLRINKYIWDRCNYTSKKIWYDRITKTGASWFAIVSISICFWIWYMDSTTLNTIVLVVSVVLFCITILINTTVFKVNDDLCEKYVVYMKEYKKHFSPKDNIEL